MRFLLRRSNNGGRALPCGQDEATLEGVIGKGLPLSEYRYCVHIAIETSRVCSRPTLRHKSIIRSSIIIAMKAIEAVSQ